MLRYKALGEWQEVTLVPLTDQQEAQNLLPTTRGGIARYSSSGYTESIARVVESSAILRSRIPDLTTFAVVQGKVAARPSHGTRRGASSPISTTLMQTFATPTVIAEGLRLADFAAAKKFGATVIEEGLDGKVLLRVETIERLFELINLMTEREVGSVTPNFVRRVSRIKMSAAKNSWSHDKIGVPVAWRITRGSADVKIAVLDEGVDTAHAALRGAVVAQRDFIGGKGNSAMPDGNDAHGTACAGIVVSRDKTFPGIAPGCSLIAARIAMDDGQGHWVFEDFATADAIDWCWRQGASVLSNSWGGGAPSDAISRAFARAQTQGREGSGAVVTIAAGNDQMPIDFPGNLPGYITVGAFNSADERKTRASSDGENWWGSNYGATMHVLAPGVFIWTTDISGPAGYGPDDFTKTFNGTSSATPAVAGAAALMISANRALSATSVRNIIGQTAFKLKGQTGWTSEEGFGGLNVGAAVAAAVVAGTLTAAKVPNKLIKIKRVAKKKAAKKK